MVLLCENTFESGSQGEKRHSVHLYKERGHHHKHSYISSEYDLADNKIVRLLAFSEGIRPSALMCIGAKTND